MNPRTLLAVSGSVWALLSPLRASAILMNVDFSGQFNAIHADVSGILPPGPTLTGRFTLDYSVADDIGDGTQARYTGGVVGGAWSIGAYSWSFVNGPENRYYVYNDVPGGRGGPSYDVFAVYSNFTGSDFYGFVPNFLELNLFAYLPYAGLQSVQPPMTVDLDDFTGPGSSRRANLAFLSAPNQNVFVEYDLTSLSLAPVANGVPEPANLGWVALGLLGIARYAQRRRKSRVKGKFGLGASAST